MFVGALSAKIAGNTVLCAETHGDKLGGLLSFGGTFFEYQYEYWKSACTGNCLV